MTSGHVRVENVLHQRSAFGGECSGKGTAQVCGGFSRRWQKNDLQVLVRSGGGVNDNEHVRMDLEMLLSCSCFVHSMNPVACTDRAAPR